MTIAEDILNIIESNESDFDDEFILTACFEFDKDFETSSIEDFLTEFITEEADENQLIKIVNRTIELLAINKKFPKVLKSLEDFKSNGYKS